MGVFLLLGLVAVLLGAALYVAVSRWLFRLGAGFGLRLMRCLALMLLLTPGFGGGHGIALMPVGLAFYSSLSGATDGLTDGFNLGLYVLAVILALAGERWLERRARRSPAADSLKPD